MASHSSTLKQPALAHLGRNEAEYFDTLLKDVPYLFDDRPVEAIDEAEDEMNTTLEKFLTRLDKELGLALDTDTREEQASTVVATVDNERGFETKASRSKRLDRLLLEKVDNQVFRSDDSLKLIRVLRDAVKGSSNIVDG